MVGSSSKTMIQNMHQNQHKYGLLTGGHGDPKQLLSSLKAWAGSDQNYSSELPVTTIIFLLVWKCVPVNSINIVTFKKKTNSGLLLEITKTRYGFWKCRH